MVHVRRSRLTPWCPTCAHRSDRGFDDFDEQELAFMDSFKQEHAIARAGDILIPQDSEGPRLFTLFSGWAGKYRSLSTGERQLLSVALPGDLLGVESVLCQRSHHSVEAVTDVSMCIFDPARTEELLSVPSLARRFACLQALEERHVGERLTSVGACDARRSLSFFIWDIYNRLERRRSADGRSFRLPLSQQQIADALGLTTVHVYRTVRALRRDGVLQIENQRVTIHNLDRLKDAACVGAHQDELRPLL